MVSLQGNLKAVHATNSLLEAELTLKSEEVPLPKQRAFLAEAAHQVDLSGLQRRMVELQTRTSQTTVSPLSEEKGELVLHLKQCEQYVTILKTGTEHQLKTMKQTNLLFEEREVRALASGLERHKYHHLKKSRLVEDKT